MSAGEGDLGTRKGRQKTAAFSAAEAASVFVGYPSPHYALDRDASSVFFPRPKTDPIVEVKLLAFAGAADKNQLTFCE
jgi:hypothetical protein